MAIVTVNGQVNTTKVFADVVGVRGPMGPPGPGNTSAITVDNTTVDLNLIKTIIDENIGATNITVHTKPANPQYTHTVLLAEMPVSATVQDFMALITIGGGNTDISDDNLNWQLTRNGVEVGNPDTITSSAGNYWYFIASFAAAPLAIGDVLGIKFWTDASVLVNFAYATIYIVPQTLSVPIGIQTVSSGGAYTQDVVQGAATGVTYRAAGVLVAPGFNDSALDVVVAGTFGSTTTPITYLKPLQAVHIAGNAYKTDRSSLASNINGSKSLYKLISGSLLRIVQNYPFSVGARLSGIWLYEPLIGSVTGTDGTDGNAVFTISHVPLAAAQLLIENDLQQVQTVAYDYTAPGGVPTITFRSGFIPRVGDVPYAGYMY